MSGRNRGGGGNKRKKQSASKKKKAADPKKFWGDPDALPTIEGFEISSPDPVAVVNSLGQPPLPGHGAASPHYFKLVYSRATQLASALAMAGEIDDLTPDDPPEPVEEGNAAVDGEDGNAAEGAEADDEMEVDELAERDADDDLIEASSDEASRSEQE